MQRVADHRRLLVDFLEHEMPVIALADHRARHRGLHHRPLHRLVRAVEHLGAATADHRPVALLQVTDALGQRGQRQCVGAEIHLAVAETHRQRAAAPRADHQVVLAGKDDRHGEGAFKPRQGPGHRIDGRHALVDITGQQMGHDLGIGLGFERRAIARQFLAQLLEILDNAVMDQRHAMGRVRMGVDLVRHAVGRPSCMANAHRAGQRLFGQPLFQVDQLALGAAAVQQPAVQRRDAGRIVTAIFQPLQPVEQKGRRRLLADNANNSAHYVFFAFFSLSLRSR
jgi:hypothetical protein